MKYGEFLRQNRVPGWEAQYLDYDGLKSLLKDKDLTEAQFVQAIRREQNRLNHFVAGKVAELVNSLVYLESHLQETSLAERVGEDIVRIDRYVNHNVTGFDKIVKKYAKHAGNSIIWYVSGKKDMWLYKARGVVHELIVHLSVFYKKRIEGENVGKWKPPASFSRNTSKYWVRPEHITEVKAFIIKNLPILEVNSSKRVEPDYYKQDLDQSHNFVSSVYLDKDTLDCYHERIRQEEGAELIRVRWYGGQVPEGGELPVPHNQLMYVEQKIHHESWVDADSTKQRFPLDQSLVPAFFKGTLDVDKAFEVMLLQGKVSEKEVAQSRDIAHGIQDSIRRRGLRPSIRTAYHRTAFQRSDSNQVRISLDFPLYLLKEVDTPDFWSNIKSPSDAEPFDFGVLEIKVVGDASTAPSWVNELLETGWLTKVTKFSKYQHATVTYYPHKVRLYPHWIEELPQLDHDEDEDDEQETTAGKAGRDAVAGAGRGGATGDTDNGTANGNSPKLSADANGHAEQRVSGVANGDNAHRVIDIDAIISGHKANGTDDGKITTAETSFSKPGDVGDDKGRRGHGRGLGLGLLRRRHGKGDQSNDGAEGDGKAGGGAGGSKKPKLKQAKLERLKVEPKTYFANERTFIQWLSASVLLITLSTAVMGLSEAARLAGTLMFPVALLFLFYSLGVYRWRLRKINRRDGTRFDDPYGPWILTIFLSLAMLAGVVIFWTHDLDETTYIYYPSCPDNVGKFVDQCGVQTPSSLSGVDFVEVQRDLPPSVFGSPAERRRMLRVAEDEITKCGKITEFKVNTARTEIRYCVEGMDCDVHYLRHRLDTKEVLLKWRDILGTNFSYPRAKAGLNNEYKVEVDTKCGTTRDAYSIKIEGAPPEPWQNVSFLDDDFLENPYYGSPLMVLSPNISYTTKFEYAIEIAGVEGEISFTAMYDSDEDRAYERTPALVQIEARVPYNLAAVRQLEGVVAVLQKDMTDDHLSRGAILGIVLAVFAVILFVALMVYRRVTGSTQED